MTVLQTVSSHMGVRGRLLCMYEVYRQLLTFSVYVKVKIIFRLKCFNLGQFTLSPSPSGRFMNN